MKTASGKLARDYAGVARKLRAGGEREETIRAVVEALWGAMEGRGVSWVGIYHKVEGREEMVLGFCRPKPACSPIGLNGMCGRCWRERRAVLVRDTAALAAGSHIACDPLDRSELVLPLLESDGTCWGVVDADSHEVGSFGEEDVEGVRRVVEGAGLSVAQKTAATLSF